MRERLTAAFVVLMAFVLLVAGVVRVFTLRDLVEEREQRNLQQSAALVAAVVAVRVQTNNRVSPDLLAGLVREGLAISVDQPDQPLVEAFGQGYDAGDREADLVATAGAGTAQVELRQSSSVTSEVLSRMIGSLVLLLFMLLLISGSAVFAIASYLSRPFRDLAAAASALGRGRFDLDLPESSIPEVNEISKALEGSSRRLEDSIRRDREFFHHASHVLRTPLTGMQLELEELAQGGRLPGDAQRGIDKVVAEVKRLDGVVDDLLEFARGRSLVAGAEVTLATLGTHIAQDWRDKLPESIEIRAYVDGGGDVRLTPGPVEQLLEHVLQEISACASGPVSLRFSGQSEHVRVRVSGGRPRGRVEPGERAASMPARTIAESLGGRVTGDILHERGLEVLLPRR